jgi:3-deoxy-D-manno-octulosonate 8-phosphate phosphatase (KDO 8-P phosphatase)
MTKTNDIPGSEQTARVRLLVLDVDGVLTDGRLLYDAGGNETKEFHVRDGYGIKQVAASGIEVAVISGRSCAAVETRIAELGIRHARLGQEDKLSALQEIAGQLSIPMDAIACIGDDAPDLPIMSAAGLGIAVADAHPAVREAADWCTHLGGGRGAVREVCDVLVATRPTGND